jgi:hypothetical protein
MRSFKDVAVQTYLNVEVGAENVSMELEDKKAKKNVDIVLDKGEAVAHAIHILTKALETTGEIEELCAFMKERVGA